MSLRVWLGVCALLLLVVAVPSAPAAAGKGNGELAKALAQFVPERLSHRTVTPAEAIASGIPAKEVREATVTATGGFAVTAATRCWQQTWHHQAGLWPYDRHIWQQTTWCDNGSAITSRSSASWPGTGPACGTSWGPSTWKAGGGAGYSSVDVTTRGGFSCTIPVLGNLQYWLWMTIRYYPGGGSAVAGYGY